MEQLYVGGKILTMESRANRYEEAVLVENGRIKAVGPEESLKALGKRAERIRLHGAVAMPAFIDAHSHISGYAFSLLQASVAVSYTHLDVYKRQESFRSAAYTLSYE